jgi:hypothetical protein
MGHTYRPHANAILAAALVAVVVAVTMLAVVAGMLVRQRLGVSPAALLRMTFAAAAQMDPRLAACPLIIVGGE